MPIIYILTNQSMPDTIKIGITDNLERRIKEFGKKDINKYKKDSHEIIGGNDE